MSFPFVLSYAIPPSAGHTDGEKSSADREIWFKSVFPFVAGQFKDIALEILKDTNPTGEDPAKAQLSFAVALCNSGSSELGDVKSTFPYTFLRLDMSTGRPFAWAGQGASAVSGAVNTISFDEDGDISAALVEGDYIYVVLSIGDIKPTDLGSSPGLERASPVLSGDPGKDSHRGPGKNIVPKDSQKKDGERREVKIGWRPLAIGGGILKPIRHLLPRETQHWAVVIGDYYHELGIDEDITVVYRNGKLVDEDFDLEDVGYTTFNDQAIVDAGNVAINQMEKVYHLIDNNCQKFCINLLDIICQVGRKRLDTIYGPAMSLPAPTFRYNKDTQKFELVDPPRVEKEEKEMGPKVIVSTQIYETTRTMIDSKLTDETVPLTEEDHKEMINHAIRFLRGE